MLLYYDNILTFPNMHGSSTQPLINKISINALSEGVIVQIEGVVYFRCSISVRCSVNTRISSLIKYLTLQIGNVHWKICGFVISAFLNLFTGGVFGGAF